MRHQQSYQFALGGFLVLLLACPSPATTIDPLTWEQLVLGSDFVGIVECTTAGGIVAHYKVIESWKNQAEYPKGKTLAIETAVNYWEPQFPIALVGNRFLVTAYRASPPATMMSTTSGGGVPLWWRNTPADLLLPLFQGRVPYPEQSTRFFDSPYKSLQKFRDAAHALLTADESSRELILLRALTYKYLFTSFGRPLPNLDKEKVNLKQLVDEAKSPATIASALMQLKHKARSDRWIVVNILSQAGGTATLEALSQDDSSTLDKKTKQLIIDRIKPSPSPESDQPTVDEPRRPEKVKVVVAEDLEPWRSQLALGPKQRGFWVAFENLTQHDPEPVATWLKGWTNPKQSWRDADLGHVLGSWFGWKCGADRTKHLSTLADSARDDYVRVAAAVYLCFEDEQAGIQRLRKLTKLQGDPGVWAALTLARRGHKDAMPRALQVFESSGRSNMEGVPHGNLQKRLLVLLSNSCSASGIAMPDFDLNSKAKKDPLFDRNNLTDAQQWWPKHQDRIKLTDPWLPLLAKQRVD